MACGLAGVAPGTARGWLARGRAGDRPYDRFERLYRIADARAELRSMCKVRAGDPNWRAVAWFMAKRWPERWGHRRRMGLPPRPRKALDRMNEEELQEYADLLDAWERGEA